MCSYPSDKFKISKPDISPYLFHFTRGYDAMDTLKKILAEEELTSKRHNFICYTASPLTSLKKFFNTYVNRTGLPMFMPYGIGFSRNVMYEKYGARNLIYGSKEELEEIKTNLPDWSWRCDELNLVTHDFEYQREWRTKGNVFNFKDFDKEEIIIITKTEEELRALSVEYYLDIEFDYEHEIRDSIAHFIEQTDGKRKWKGFALENLVKENDIELSGATIEQKLGEQIKNQ